MGRGSGGNPPGRRMNVGTLIASAFPRHASKHIESVLGCSPRQAQRIAETGKVPGRFRLAMIRAIDVAIANRISVLEHDQAVAKAQAHAEMLERAAHRRQQAADPCAPMATGQANGPAQDDLLAGAALTERRP